MNKDLTVLVIIGLIIVPNIVRPSILILWMNFSLGQFSHTVFVIHYINGMSYNVKSKSLLNFPLSVNTLVYEHIYTTSYSMYVYTYEIMNHLYTIPCSTIAVPSSLPLANSGYRR